MCTGARLDSANSVSGYDLAPERQTRTEENPEEFRRQVHAGQLETETQGTVTGAHSPAAQPSERASRGPHRRQSGRLRDPAETSRCSAARYVQPLPRRFLLPHEPRSSQLPHWGVATTTRSRRSGRGHHPVHRVIGARSLSWGNAGQCVQSHPPPLLPQPAEPPLLLPLSDEPALPLSKLLRA